MSSGISWQSFWSHLRKYLTVGLGSAATDLTVFLLLTRYGGWQAYEANLISRPCGGLFCFTFNKLWTFGRRELRDTGAQFTRFWIMWLAAFAISDLLVWWFSRFEGLSPLLSKLAAEAAVNLVAFLVMRHWTFATVGRPSLRLSA